MVRDHVLNIQDKLAISNAKMAEFMEISVVGYAAKKSEKQTSKRFTEENLTKLKNNLKKIVDSFGI